MKTVNLEVSGLNAQVMGVHLLLVIKNYVTGKKVGSIAPKKMEMVQAMDQVYQKLDRLTESHDDETPQELSLTIAEAEAMIRAFTDEEFTNGVLKDKFYQKQSYTSYFGLIYSKYLKMLSERYVDALAAA